MMFNLSIMNFLKDGLRRKQQSYTDTTLHLGSIDSNDKLFPQINTIHCYQPT